MPDDDATMPSPPAFPAYREAARYWLRLGCVSFGGPAGQIAMMHTELVERRRWISEAHFLRALNFCMLLPGPEAQQLATYLGWRLHGAKGGLTAGALFVLPSAALLFLLSWLYMRSGHVPELAAVFYGLLPAVIAIIADAVLRIGKKALRTRALWGVAVMSFVAIYFFKVSFVVIILACAVIGWAGHRVAPGQFPDGKSGAGAGRDGDDGERGVLPLPPCPAETWGRTLRVVCVGLLLWWVPILAAGAALGWHSTAFTQGVFFSKAALVTFGGAYAVLPYVAQQAVERHGWLTHAQMMSGLALAETTPGPLIMVLQFVGFAGGWQHPEGLSPLAGAAVCAAITTWATFVPCFLFIFLGGPHLDRMGRHPRLGAALTAVTAAVTGVILNLGVQFAAHALWPAGAGGIGVDWFVAAAAAGAFVAMRCFQAGMLPVIGVCAAAGFVWRMWW